MSMPGSIPAPPPAQFPASDPTAVMGRRIGAYVIDVVIGWIVFGLLVVAMGDTTDSPLLECGDSDAPAICFDAGDTIYFADDDTAAGIFLLTVGWWMLMGTVVQGATGGTPGKLMVGLRVIDQRTGRLAGFGKSAGRTLMWIVDSLPFLPLVGLITGVATKGHRRVGDMVAKTFVVDKRSVGVPPMVPGLTVHASTYAPAPPPGGFAAPPPATPPPPPAPPLAAEPPAPSTPATDPFAPPGAPTPDAPTPDAAPAEPVTPPAREGVDAPMWDAERGAYIQWDKVHQLWMIYDDPAGKWKPLA